MHDPSTSTSSPNPLSSPSTLDETAWTGLRVLSGTGEDLGTATGIARDAWGAPKWVVFRETPDAPARRVRLSFVRGVEEGAIRLMGPRQGFHITRVGRD